MLVIKTPDFISKVKENCNLKAKVGNKILLKFFIEVLIWVPTKTIKLVYWILPIFTESRLPMRQSSQNYQDPRFNFNLGNTLAAFFKKSEKF